MYVTFHFLSSSVNITTTMAEPAKPPKCKELYAMIVALQTEVDNLKAQRPVSEQSALPIAPSIEINNLRSEYETKFAKMKESYERDIAHLEDKLMLVMKTSSETSLGCINTWISSLDKKIDEMIVEIDVVKHNEQIDRNKNGIVNLNKLVDELNQRPNTSNEQFTIPTQSAEARHSAELSSLVSRVDYLEDYSRRDNLLFYGFDEEREENCKEKVRGLIYDKLLTDIDVENENDNDIKFVRVHRVGKYDRKYKRAIIARFENYETKQAVLKSCRNLPADSPYKVSEDFSTNTKNLRKNLLDYCRIIKNQLKGRIETAFVNYKSLVIKINGKYHRHTVEFIRATVDEHPNSWCEYLVNTQKRTGQKPATDTRRNNMGDVWEDASPVFTSHNASGGIVPPASSSQEGPSRGRRASR